MPATVLARRKGRSGFPWRRTRTQAACRLHEVLGGLVPGGVPKAITTARAARVLKALRPAGAVEAARCELAADLLDDLRRIDARIRETRKKVAVAVAAADTSLTGLFGVGPVIAAAIIGDRRIPLTQRGFRFARRPERAKMTRVQRGSG